jgi:type II secretory pathway pseudopilin PulG
VKKTFIQGITLIEVLLVLVIAAVILALGIQQYQFYKRDADIDQVKNSVDTVFQAMSHYYWANCSPPSGYDQNPCGTSARSALVVCPTTVTTVVNPVTINITTDLITPSFLTASNLTIQNIIDHKDQNGLTSAINGYTLQYNLFYKPDSNIPTRQFCKDNVCTTVAFIIIWKMQIGVKLTLDASKFADNYKNLLEADCTSDYADKCGTFPPPPPPPVGQPVPPVTPTAKYLIFTRYPGQVNSEAQSIYWQLNPIAKDFKQQYENQADWYLATNASTPRYYYCAH